ncbi:hypothetical protein [Actinomadura madurae]|uniref:hypothetical protein n=1 Tax=Actinomadura madurae TaxID=1993 RepID=UPI0020D207AA|nr:hypothetical protein [Actinomadura madurae]MCQ0013479.1 hypothetical protein [Actinomadura madurae]
MQPVPPVRRLLEQVHVGQRLQLLPGPPPLLGGEDGGRVQADVGSRVQAQETEGAGRVRRQRAVGPAERRAHRDAVVVGRREQVQPAALVLEFPAQLGR